jgi:hypothetical protein
MRTPRRLIGIVIAAAALFALPASAQALTLSGLSAGPIGTNATQAGAHKDFQIQMDFSGGQVKDLTIGLPAGEVGDPTATPKCSQAAFDAANCPADTAVGDVSATATILGILGPVPVTGNLYNFNPLPGEPARFAIILHPLGIGIVPAIKLQSAVQLRPTDYGLTTIINNIPNTTLLAGDTTITSQTITLWGSNVDHPTLSKPFARNPTSCTQHTTTFSAVPYSGADASGNASFTPTNCAGLDFSPSFTATLGGAAQGTPTTAVTSIDQDVDEAGLLNAHVFVPPDLAPNTLTDLLSHRCAPADFQAGTCLDNTLVGNAIATSPLLSEPLAGQVHLVDNGGGLLPNIGLDLRGQLHLLLQGSLNADKSVTFGDVPPGLPDIPIAHFILTFTNPPGLLIANRNLCIGARPVWHAEFTGYNGASASVDSTASVQGPCGSNAGASKCKKAKKKRGHHRAAASKKKHKKSCKKKKRHKKHR